MTDDKVAGEGPYTSGLPDNAAVINKKSCISYTGLERRSVNAVCGWMNEAYAEGRKAMEKEFNELLELANEAGQFNKDMMEWKIKFDSWKKARGIE